MIKKYEFAFDPRTRLCLVLCLTTLSLFFNRVDVLLSLLTLSIILSVLFGGIKQVSMIKRARWLITFFVLIAIMQSIFSPSGEILFEVKGVILLSVGGLTGGAAFLCRLGIIIVSATILKAGGSRKMIQGLVQMKVPYEIAFMVSMALSFLPMMTEEMQNSLTALQLRGIELKKVPFGKRIKVYTYLFFPVISGMMVKAKELSLAMEMRAFRAYPTRSSYVRLRMTALDYMIVAIAIISSICISYFIR